MVKPHGYLAQLGKRATAEKYADREAPLEVRVHNARLRAKGQWPSRDHQAKARSVKRRTTPQSGS